MTSMDCTLRLIQCFLISWIAVVAVSSAPRNINRRGIVALGTIVGEYTGRNPLDYNRYGCFCGLGGEGTPMDDVDRCCQKHDECWTIPECPAPHVILSKVDCNNGTCSCKDRQGSCNFKLCQCDIDFAICLTMAKYNSSLKNVCRKPKQSDTSPSPSTTGNVTAVTPSSHSSYTDATAVTSEKLSSYVSISMPPEVKSTADGKATHGNISSASLGETTKPSVTK